MNFDTYIEKTRETAIYPEETERDYVIHGLVDELGELIQAVNEIPENHNGSPPKVGDTDNKRVCKEMGDAMWYLARLADHFEFDMSESFSRDLSISTMNPEVGREELESAFLEAAKINGHQKKMIRDNTDKSDLIKDCAESILLSFRTAAHHLGLFDIQVVMQRNVYKLLDRIERGVVHGDGDNR